MLPKVTKTPEKSSKTSDSESKIDKEVGKSGLKFNAEDIKFAESINRKRKKDKSSDLESSAKQDNTELKRIKKKEHNVTSSSSKLAHKCNKINNIKSKNKSEIQSEDFFLSNEIPTPNQGQNSKFSTKENNKDDQNNKSNESVDASLSTVQETIKSQSTKTKKCDKTVESESSEQNQSANFKKTLSDREKRKEITRKELKFRPKRRRIISSDSSETIVEEENENFAHDFQIKDNNVNVNVNSKFVKVETKAKKHIPEKKFNDNLNSKFISDSENKHSESDTIESVISKSDSESKVIEDDEDWNYKPKRIKSHNLFKSTSKVEKNHKSSESDSELVEVVRNKASNSKSEKVDDSHKFYRKKDKKFVVNKQFEKSESNSIEVSSSKSSDSEPEQVDKKVFRNDLQKKYISTTKSDMNKQHERAESDLIEEYHSEFSDSESEIKIRNVLNQKSPKRKSPDEFTAMIKPKVNEKLGKSEFHSTEEDNSKPSDSKSNKVDGTSYNHKSQTRQSHNISNQLSNNKIDGVQKISESDSVRIDSSEASNSETENVTLNDNSQKQELQNKSCPMLTSDLDKKLSESESDSIELASSKYSDSETEETNQNTLNFNSPRAKSKADWEQETSESDSINVTSSKASDSESEKINQNTSNYNSQRRKLRRANSKVDRKQELSESDSKIDNSKSSDSEYEEINLNTSNCNSQKRKSSQDESSSILTNNLEKGQTELESSSSKHVESESEKVDKNVSSSNSRKTNLKHKSCSKTCSPKKRKLRNSESDTIDVINAEVSDSEPKKINVNNSKHKSPRNKSEMDLKSTKPKREKLTFLDAFLRKQVTEDKVSETSDVSDFVLELEEEDCNIEEIDPDEEEDKEEIGKVNMDRISYWPTNQELRKLKSMRINLKHNAPPQHNIEKSSGTRSLSKEEKREFEKYNTLKRGAFSKNEDRILKRNWINFCKLYDWDANNPKPFLHMKYKNKEFFLGRREDRMKFVQFLANGLFDRSLYSVYQRFRILFEPHKVTRYKSEEDRIILDFMRKNQIQANETFVNSRDRKFADLALILRRTRASVWRRYRVLQKKQRKRNRGRDSDNLSDSY